VIVNRKVRAAIVAVKIISHEPATNDKAMKRIRANLNVTIDETALMFQQTVVSVYQSTSNQSSDTTRWGETSIQEEKEYEASILPHHDLKY
jgi:hypothetical protein